MLYQGRSDQPWQFFQFAGDGRVLRSDLIARSVTPESVDDLGDDMQLSMQALGLLPWLSDYLTEARNLRDVRLLALKCGWGVSAVLLHELPLDGRTDRLHLEALTRTWGSDHRPAPHHHGARRRGGGAGQGRSVGSGSAQVPVALARMAHDEGMVFNEPGRAAAVSETLEQAADLCANVVDVTSGLGGVRITGPSAHLLLAGVTELDASPDALPNMSCAQTKIAEVHAVLLRVDVGSVCSYEVYFGREFGEYMWDALLEAGDEHGTTPVGVEAMAGLQEIAPAEEA